MNRKCTLLRKLQNKIQQTTLQRLRCITDETAAERMQGRMSLAANLGFTILQLLPLSSDHLSYFHFLPHPTLSATLISFEEENVVSFFLRILIFCPEDHCWQSHLMQCNEANPFSLSFFFLFVTKTFVTNCVLCWTGTSSCGSEKRNGGVDM